MSFDYNVDRKETGVDVTLKTDAGDQTLTDPIPVTSASYSEEADTSEVSFNNSYSQDIAVTGVTYSGSFEVAGRNEDLRNAFWGQNTENEGDETSLPAYVTNIEFEDGNNNTFQFRNCIVTSHSKDAPADDRTTGSYDFTAELLRKNP